MSNLFIGTSNQQLKECFESYKRIQINKRNKKEIFDDMQSGYIESVECDDEKKKNIIAFAIARDHMFNEIGNRYFKICDDFQSIID